ALDALIHELEKTKFAATDRMRSSRSLAASNGRYISAEVRHVVWVRDGGQCTFVSKNGRRCPCRSGLEFDHAEAFARGGANTIENLGLRCRTHNRYAADKTFGADFMKRKREAARAAAEARETSTTRGPVESGSEHLSTEQALVRGLRN